MIAMPGIMLPIWYVLFSEKSVMDKSFRDGAATKVLSQIENSAGFILLTSSSSEVVDLIRSGREYQRVLIQCRSMNIEVHPISQILEEVPFKDNIGAEIDIEDNIQFILRVGKIGKKNIDYETDVIASASISIHLDELIK